MNGIGLARRVGRKGTLVVMAAVALSALPVFAQDDSVVGTDALDLRAVEKGDDAADIKEIDVWYLNGQIGLNLVQSSYSDNWSGGDQGSASWTAVFRASAERQMSERWNWFNRVYLTFGQIHQQERDPESNELSWQAPSKTNDEIDLESLLRYTPPGGWSPYLSFRFQSQFLDASDPYGRELAFNPLDFREAVGMSRAFIDTEERLFLGRLGFALRQMSREFYLAPPEVSDATDRSSSTDGGLEMRVDYRSPILGGRAAWSSRFTAYRPLYYSAEDEFDAIGEAQLAAAGLPSDLPDYPLGVGVDWQNLLTAKITSVIAVTLELRWVYDKYDNSVVPQFDDVGELTNADAVDQAIRKKGQFKEVFSLGLAYVF
ncbi:MAG: DUF3078 domain-containing protein [Candidatus Krumholzibacteriia bacterium]